MSGEYNPMYKLDFEQQAMPQTTKSPDFAHTLKPDKLVKLTTCNNPTITSACKSQKNPASVVPPEEGSVTPETCTGLQHK
jgi:hypothetical protein